MSSEIKIPRTNKMSVGDYCDRTDDKKISIMPSCPNFVRTKKPRGKKIKVSRKRLSFSPVINSVVMQSKDCSPIVTSEKSEFDSTNSPTGPFSSRAINRILQSEAENFLQNLSYLSKTISIGNLLKTKKMDKYDDVFQKAEIDNMAVFLSLTDRDLIEIGIKNKKDRAEILEIVAEHQDDI